MMRSASASAHLGGHARRLEPCGAPTASARSSSERSSVRLLASGPPASGSSSSWPHPITVPPLHAREGNRASNSTPRT